MSLKIYNGYCLPKLSFEELFSFCTTVRECFNDAVINKWRSLYTKEEYREKWSSIHKSVFEAEQKGLRHPLDFKSEAIFIPVNDKILIITFWEQSTLFEPLWKKVGGNTLKYYGYWNNTDKLENISGEEWEIRGREWEDALEPICIPLMAGFSFTFTAGSVPLPEEVFPGL